MEQLSVDKVVEFNLSKVREVVGELRKIKVREAVYPLEIEWHPLARSIAQSMVAECRKMHISTTYIEQKGKYQLVFNFSRVQN